MFFSRLASVFLLMAGLTFAHSQPAAPGMTLTANDGTYCENGSLILLNPEPDDPPHLKTWGTFCHQEDKPSPFAQTSTFRAPRFMRFYAIGWAKSPTFSLQRVSDGLKFPLVPFDQNQTHWSWSDYELPADWRGTEVRITAEGAPEKGLWRAFSEPLESGGRAPMGDAIKLLGLTTLHFAALMLCALAVAALAVWGGVRDRVQAGLVTLTATAIPGYFVFWLTFCMPRASRYYAMAFFLAAALALFVALKKLDDAGRAVLKSLFAPLLLTGTVALMVLCSGFLYGGMNDAQARAQTRYLPRLPPDNEIPLLLALGTRLPHVPSPLQGNWLASDRPPLQSGIVLAHFPLFRKPREQGYTVISVLAQSLWVFGLWLLLSAFALSPRAISVALAACLFSGFAFLNTFFVWPKMLAAAYGFGFLAALVAKPPKQLARLGWAIPGALLAFSLLSHGGTAFALVPAVPLILLWKKPAPVKRMAAAILFGVLIYSPWMLYQKFYDPPANRLLKYHLAGVEQVDPRPFGETLKTAYGKLPWSEIAHYKQQNFSFAFGEGWLSLQRTGLLLRSLVQGRWEDAAKRGFELREQMFFHPAPTLGLFLFAPFALLCGLSRRGRTTEWRTACLFWIFTLAASAFWCLAMFGPSSTSIHQGAYVTMLLAFVASVLSLWALWPPLAVLIALIEMGVSFLLNEVLIRVPYPGGLMPEGLLHKDTFALLCAMFAANLWLLVKLGQEKRATLLPESPASVSCERRT